MYAAVSESSNLSNKTSWDDFMVLHAHFRLWVGSTGKKREEVRFEQSQNQLTTGLKSPKKTPEK